MKRLTYILSLLLISLVSFGQTPLTPSEFKTRVDDSIRNQTTPRSITTDIISNRYAELADMVGAKMDTAALDIPIDLDSILATGGNEFGGEYTAGTKDNYTVVVISNDTKRMWVFNDGNVCINCAGVNAGYKFDVNGTSRFQNTVTTLTDVILNTINAGRGPGTNGTRFGMNAGANVTTANYYNYFGYEAGYASTTGNGSAFGYQALRNNVEGTLNATFGNISLNPPIGQSISNSSALGHGAGNGCYGSGNLYLGFQAGFGGGNMSDSLVMANSNTQWAITGNFSTGNIYFKNAIKTGAPTGSGASFFKSGTVLTGSDTKKYWEVEIDGTDYYIELKTSLP